MEVVDSRCFGFGVELVGSRSMVVVGVIVVGNTCLGCSVVRNTDSFVEVGSGMMAKEVAWFAQ